MPVKQYLLAACLMSGFGCGLAAQSLPTGDAPFLAPWPQVRSAIASDPRIEAEVGRILALMSLPQKIGQMTQPEINFVTPEQVREFHIGSVLNGGSSWPQGNKRAPLADWVNLADRFYDASMATDLPVKVPVIWGTDAIHGHGNAFGATIFPHNIGLGATRDLDLVRQIAQAAGRQVRATGINWVFGPTLAVARDVRWGRTYESFSQDPSIVRAYAKAYVEGLQGQFSSEANVVATAKHFLGDGATEWGIDQGVAKVALADMTGIHAQGYAGALEAGVQAVMVSLSSWDDVSAGVNHGKMHGSKTLLTDVLKGRMGFDGLVVTDWNGISQVPGCSQSSCAQAINAGVDMVMVPENWRAFIANTIAQVERGQIPMARIDDAVSRILRVKLRAGLFGKKPSAGLHAGSAEALQARALARRAVRSSQVLLKNDRQVLPLVRAGRILVLGKSADSVQNQTGGWSMGWQGTENFNSDFPAADTVLAGIQELVGQSRVDFHETAQGVDLSRYDAVIAVIGETPYAEFSGDIALSDTLRHSGRYPEDLSLLQDVFGKGRPLVTVFLSGRPAYVNDLLNLSDAFVAAWLPGTEGRGVADLLFRDGAGKVAHDFSGLLSFDWPGSPCQSGPGLPEPWPAPLFRMGYGLNYRSTTTLGWLDLHEARAGCGKQEAVSIFNLVDRKPYVLHVSSAANQWLRVRVGTDLNSTLDLPAHAPAIRVQTTQVNTQHDAKLVTWYGPARFFASAEQKQGLRSYAIDQGVLQFDILLKQAAQAKVSLAVECEAPCRGEVDLSQVLGRMPLERKKTLKIPLMCFDETGADFLNVDVPFSVETSKPFSAAFTRIQIVSGAAADADALSCTDVGVPGK